MQSLNDTRDLITIQSDFISGSVAGDISQIWYFDNIHKYDSINFEETHLSDRVDWGSGTPVFFKYLTGGTEMIVFGGVLRGSSDFFDSVNVVRPENVEKFLK